MKITERKFFDVDIVKVQVAETTIELDLLEGVEAVLLNSEDVKAMAMYFGLIQG